MATWYDLPAEMKQNILEYLISDLTIEFVPRHAATRTTTTKQIKENEAEGSGPVNAITSLLLVSKHFLKYRELESVLLSGATIRLDEPRALHKIEKRFTAEGLACIRSLLIVYNLKRWRRHAPDALPAGAFIKTKLRALQKLTIYLSDVPYRLPSCPFTVLEMARVAMGGSVDVTERDVMFAYGMVCRLSGTQEELTKLAQTATQGLLARFLDYYGYILSKPLFILMHPEVGSNKYERVLQWNVDFVSPDQETMQQQTIEFSTKNWCVELEAGERSFYLPQRLRRPEYETAYPLWDRETKAVALDKYYTSRS